MADKPALTEAFTIDVDRAGAPTKISVGGVEQRHVRALTLRAAVDEPSVLTLEHVAIEGSVTGEATIRHVTDPTEDRSPVTEALTGASVAFLLDHRQYRCNMASLSIREWLEQVEAEARRNADAVLREALDHLLVCRCPERPRCRPHRDDGVHQWLDLCEQPHEHGEPVVGRNTRAALATPIADPPEDEPTENEIDDAERRHELESRLP